MDCFLQYSLRLTLTKRKLNGNLMKICFAIKIKPALFRSNSTYSINDTPEPFTVKMTTDCLENMLDIAVIK